MVFPLNMGISAQTFPINQSADGEDDAMTLDGEGGSPLHGELHERGQNMEDL